ncbi:hypothetical protein [Streptomyces ardesiacus]
MTVDEILEAITEHLSNFPQILSFSHIGDGELGIETEAGRIYITIEEV